MALYMKKIRYKENMEKLIKSNSGFSQYINYNIRFQTILPLIFIVQYRGFKLTFCVRVAIVLL